MTADNKPNTSDSPEADHGRTVSEHQGSDENERAAPAGANPQTPEIDPVAVVRANHAEIIGGYADGRSLVELADELGLKPIQIRAVINGDRELRARWDAAREHRAESFMEEAGVHAYRAGRAGEHKAAGDLYIKLAEKTNPRVYGTKSSVELTGAGGKNLSAVSDEQLEIIIAAAQRGVK